MEISRFRGIRVRMFHNDHAPPHFHAFYGEYSVSMEIWSGAVRGYLPPRALRDLLEWYDLHRAELVLNWELLSDARAPRRIDPLE